MKAIIVRVALHLLRFFGVFSIARWATRRKLRILCYHGLWYGDDPHYGDCLYMAPSRFERRMRWLARSGYPILGLDEAVGKLRSGTVPANAVVITIDDGWYSSFKGMVPVLKALNLPATLYVTTYYVTRGGPVLNVMLDFMVKRAPAASLRYDDLVPRETPPGFPEDSVGGRSWIAARLAAAADQLPTLPERIEFVREIAHRLGNDFDGLVRERIFDLMSESELQAAQASGVDIQLHTHTHRMHDFSPEKVLEELSENRRQLARMLKRPLQSFRHFCFPKGDFHPKVFDTLRRNGIQSATTTDTGLVKADDDHMQLNRILDCESMTQIEFEARLCGLWEILNALRGKSGAQTQRPVYQVS